MRPPVPRPTAAVYVDGFNLFRRALQRRDELTWLDLDLLCARLLRTLDIGQSRYFTARVRHVEGKDPRAPQNQERYLRALATLPSVSLHFGTFRADRRWMAVSPVKPDRIVHRDQKSYFAVLLDDNNRKPIARLWFNGKKQKYLGLFDEDKVETKHPIVNLDDIYLHATAIREATQRHSS